MRRIISESSTCLFQVGIVVAPKVRDHLNPCWFDYLASYNQVSEILLICGIWTMFIMIPIATLAKICVK